MSEVSLGQFDWLHVSWPPKVCLLFYSPFIMLNKYVYREIFNKIVLNYYLSSNGHIQSGYFSLDNPLLTFFFYYLILQWFWSMTFFLCCELRYIWFTPSMQRIEYLFQEILWDHFHIEWHILKNMTLLSSDDKMWLRSLVIFDNYVFVLWIISKF